MSNDTNIPVTVSEGEWNFQKPGKEVTYKLPPNPELEKAKTLAAEYGRNWNDMGAYERRDYLDAVNDPYCPYCATEHPDDCNCACA